MNDAQQLLIPEKIKVGFQAREGTYTKKLAYVIYYDQKGVLRKEKSWEGWRDKNIAAEEFKNEPTEGFVLNKKVGGYKSHWNFRDAHVRVYDPRGFEFEISVPNLLFILRECDCSRGKGLEGKFVYAWEGTELVLLPVCSVDYKNSTDYTNLQSCKVKAKELIPGASYRTKKQDVYVYLGKFIKHVVHGNGSWEKEKTGPRQLFWDGKNFVFLTSMATIATIHSDTISPDFAELVDKYNKSVHGSKPIRLFTKEIEPVVTGSPYWSRTYWTNEESPGVFLLCYSSYTSKYDEKLKNYVYSEDPSCITVNRRVTIKDGILCSDSVSKSAYRDPAETARQRSMRNSSYYSRSQPDNLLDEYIEPTKMALWVELENGSEFQVSDCSLVDATPQTEDYDDGEDDNYDEE
jgi:hypothetical protein